MTKQMEGSEQQSSKDENGSMGQSGSLVGQPGLHGMKNLNPELLTKTLGYRFGLMKKTIYTNNNSTLGSGIWIDNFV